MEGATILHLDPDYEVLNDVSQCLTKEGYKVVTALNSDEAMKKTKIYHPDLLILEIDLPKEEGFQICKSVRNSSNSAIIVLSKKDSVKDRIDSFRAGADDYLTKPFSQRELLARVKAVLRRVAEPSQSKSNTVLHFPYLIIDKVAHQVRTPKGSISLTKKEFDIIWYLASNPGKVVTRKEILKEVWGSEDLVDTEEVTVMISRLRNKIEDDFKNPHYITTVWGVGYKFNPNYSNY